MLKLPVRAMVVMIPTDNSEEIGVRPIVDREQADQVLAAIGPVDRKNILMVGDSLTSDMQGGRSAGILCCWYNPLGEPRPADPRIDYDIRDLRQVEQILDRAGAAEAPAP